MRAPGDWSWWLCGHLLRHRPSGACIASRVVGLLRAVLRKLRRTTAGTPRCHAGEGLGGVHRNVRASGSRMVARQAGALIREVYARERETGSGFGVHAEE